ncbi:MAG: CvpA family protein [Planctomycetes bacterium]|nr:CvpA family protein [Planctomycetota bacterium]
MQVVAILLLLVIFGIMIYGGISSGFFDSVYALMRNLLGFVLALSLCDPLTCLMTGLITRFKLHPGPLYMRMIVFATVFGVTVGVAGTLRRKLTSPDLPSYPIADPVAGGILGVFNGLVVSGFVLILYALLPFVKYIPGDAGRIETQKLPVDSGALMLKYYGYLSDRMGGSKKFLVDPEPVLPGGDRNGDGLPDGRNPVPGKAFRDLNGNGRWDRGWLWRYRSHADISFVDYQRAASTVITVE